MSEEVEALRAELSNAVFNGAIPDLGNPNTGFAQRQIAEWVVASDWLAARVASAAAENAALRARLEALADSWEAKGRDWYWNSASRNVWLTAAYDLRAVLAAAHDEGSPPYRVVDYGCRHGEAAPPHRPDPLSDPGIPDWQPPRWWRRLRGRE